MCSELAHLYKVVGSEDNLPGYILVFGEVGHFGVRPPDGRFRNLSAEETGRDATNGQDKAGNQPLTMLV